jgi:hypothetical protein
VAAGARAYGPPMPAKKTLAAALVAATLTVALTAATSASAVTIWTIRAAAAPTTNGVMVMALPDGAVAAKIAGTLDPSASPVLQPLSAARAQAEQWQLLPVDGHAIVDPKFRIWSPSLGRCLTSAGNVVFSACLAYPQYETWRLYDPTPNGGMGPVRLPFSNSPQGYWLRNDNTGWCLTVPGANYAPGQRLNKLAPCTMAGSRMFRLSRAEV